MFNRIINKISGDYNEKQIKKLWPIVKQINEFDAQYDKLTDDQIKAKTQEFKDRLAKWETLDQILPEAFAVVKQACKRMMDQEIEVKWEKQIRNMIPYDVQLIGWIILHKWIISEMKTWEGKTLVAVMPVYLNALTGKGVHVVTVNDYLASRDAQRMWVIYTRLGLSIGCVTKSVPVNKRREEYSKDITYVENSELGFDYLRDNLVKSMKERALIWRPLNYTIVDEIDSILIDEARTPLIISEPNEEATEKYEYYAKISKTLIPCTAKKKVSKWLLHELLNDDKKMKDQEEDGDYYIDEKTKTASLSGRWIARLEEILWVENLYKDIWYEEIHHIENALRAQAVYEKDKEYIVKDNEVLIVDEHTWRTMPGRRFSEWLHQAIEAKEWVRIQRESKTLATITYQNFFKQYKKLAGMTGTALTEWEEFEQIYNLSVLDIPTNKPTIRADRNDKVYFNQNAKWKFVKQYIQFAHEVGQPILIWTSSIQTSEHVSRMLEKEWITHYVLNAKFHEQEAHIVAQAWKFQSVVVATNMAWRWTDIKLEKWLNEKLADNYAKRVKKMITEDKNKITEDEKNEWQGVSMTVYSQIEFELTMDGLKRQRWVSDEQIRNGEKDWTEMKWIWMKIRFNSWKKKNIDPFAEIIFKSDENKIPTIISKDIHYWLFILWTEKHESRRIDNQLRWRAGRQWDPGVSVFFVALDDLIMRKMWWERIQSMAAILLWKSELENLELTQKQFTNSIVRAQKQMEGRHFGIRKHLFDYDSVINKQRMAVYKKRDEIIESENDPQLKKKFVDHMRGEIVNNMFDIVGKQIQDAKMVNQSMVDFLNIINKEFALNFDKNTFDKFASMSWDELKIELDKHVVDGLKNKFNLIDEDRLYQIFKDVYLYHIDTLRIKHLDEMEYLRDKVWLMWYAQLDPLIVYKTEAFDKFQILLYRLKFDTTAYIASIDFVWLSQPEQTQKIILENRKTEEEYLKILEQVSEKVKDFIPIVKDKTIKSEKVVYQNEDGFEIFEVKDDEPVGKPVVEDNEWKVIDINENKKVRPNDPCPCGSGKKYKKCCGANK